jgi:hypothetical protein
MGLSAPRLKSVAVTVLSVPMAFAFGWCLGIEGDDWFYVTTIMVLETLLLRGSLSVVRSCVIVIPGLGDRYRWLS